MSTPEMLAAAAPTISTAAIATVMMERMRRRRRSKAGMSCMAVSFGVFSTGSATWTRRSEMQ
jgi:ABC-type cobalamin transport system permease subunit